MSETSLKFKGFTISKDDFESKYDVVLSDLEWKLVCDRANNEWELRVAELRNIAFKSIKSGMNSIGYNVQLKGKDITFKK